MSSTRYWAGFHDGYQEALGDIAGKLLEGGVEAVEDWLADNTAVRT
jgi:hypothetical protein